MADSNILIEKEIVMKKISEIKPYIRNPRKNDKTVDLLCKIIPKVGFNQPILIDEKGVIVKGHARYTAAIRLGLKEVPCVVSHADEEAIKADRIADNKIPEFSEWIDEELLHELDSLDFDFDFSELGLQTSVVEEIPSFDDAVADDSDDSEITEEQRKRLYEEFLKQQEEEAAKESAADAQIVTPSDIEKAKEAQKATAAPPPKYYKCVCEKCGHIMFVREGDICDRMEE